MSETPASTDTTTEAPAAPEAGKEPEVFDKAYVKQLRDEAAAARHAKKDAVEAAVAAAKAEHARELADRDVRYTELQNELGKAWIELEKYQVTLAAKVPSDKVEAFRAILQGEDKESIEASAKSAYELAGGFKTTTPAFDPSQGTGGRPAPLALNGDGILNAMMAVLNK